jgi:hypothetical protein
LNLQVWFQDRVIPEEYTNVIAGFEPLCVMVDYKNFLPKYRDDKDWPGSVLEINGSAEEFKAYYGQDVYNKIKQPGDSETIELAKYILSDLASRYEFDDLARAVKSERFLSWKAKGKIPPYLWINAHTHNGFFVTWPDSLRHRPYPDQPYKYGNLFVAGDWTRSGIDIPCMEGAARSGRMAVRGILGKGISYWIRYHLLERSRHFYESPPHLPPLAPRTLEHLHLPDAPAGAVSTGGAHAGRRRSGNHRRERDRTELPARRPCRNLLHDTGRSKSL